MKKPKTINWAIPIEMLMDDRKLQRAKESKDAIDTALLELGLPRVGTGALENNRSIFKGIEHLLDEPPMNFGTGFPDRARRKKYKDAD